MTTNKPQKLRQLLKMKKSLLMPVAHDALTAKLIAQASFEAFSIGGFGLAASHFGLPDIGVLTQGDFQPSIKNILASSALPALVDGDTGYGNGESIKRLVREYEALGAAAIFIEDQVWPKRCGHTGVKEIVAAEEMAEKIKAAVEAKTNPDFLIMARTDARSALGSVEAAIERARVYLKAGAEAIFIEAPRTIEEIKIIPQALPGTILLINMMEGGQTPLCSQKDLGKWGYKLIAYPISSLLTMVKAISETLEYLKIHGTTNDYFVRNMASFEELKNLLNFDQISVPNPQTKTRRKEKR
ncbi:MAG: PEP phosphonomutase-like protein enzyme [Candidatus Magasanikbacteria bacterium GW2011_GWA2_42_32]|uniref:PEP phosphonomutase-like protein enzyme n=1 Tax=Candidatus Magasanikbacteria bacterium GW2011_GWA2_42_32 TaxID=1619039 RepID=A0A0G1A029_9BACT|nr:MAG: PEP phosphonomutase-like protein enzyme [Candidatus Magasanikbacteria bacterium GW2011_GWA2_42_32]